jgi:hypothetical protein
MNRFVFCLPALLLPAFATPGRAAPAKPEPANAAIEKVVADNLEAAKKGDWKRYAELIHPDSLDDYKKMWLPALTAAKKAPDQQGALLPLFDGAKDVQSLIDLKPEEFVVRSMKGIAAQFRQADNPGPLAAESKIIGTVREGEDRAHVVVRTRRKFGEAEMAQVEVVSLKRSGTEWKMLLPDSVRIMAETFGRAAGNVQRAGPVKDRVLPDK